MLSLSLEHLELEDIELKKNSMQQLFNGCCELREFTLITGEPLDHVRTILRAADRHRKLQILRLDAHCSISAFNKYAELAMTPVVFAEILAEYPWLSSLFLNTYYDDARIQYSRSDGGSLTMGVGDFDKAAEVEVLARACSGAIELDLELTVRSADIQNALGKHMGKALQELSISFRDNAPEYGDIDYDEESAHYVPEVLFTLPCLCPNLLRLVLSNMTVTDTWLSKIAKSCKQLQALYLYHPDENGGIPVTDAGMSVLFAECRSLRDLRVSNYTEITSRTLQSIIDADLHLQVFFWSGVGFDEDDVDKFCQIAKRKQFLPMPVFIEEED